MVHAFWFGYEVEKSRRADMRGVAAARSGRRHEDHPRQESVAWMTGSDDLKSGKPQRGAEAAQRGAEVAGESWGRRLLGLWR